MREIRQSGSVEGVMSNHDSYSDVGACYLEDLQGALGMLGVAVVIRQGSSTPSSRAANARCYWWCGLREVMAEECWDK